MKKSHVAASVVLAAVSAWSITTATAAPRLPTHAPQSLIETVGYRSYCVRWRHICSNRWGWGSWRYRRCVTLRGCG